MSFSIRLSFLSSALTQLTTIVSTEASLVEPFHHESEEEAFEKIICTNVTVPYRYFGRDTGEVGGDVRAVTRVCSEFGYSANVVSVGSDLFLKLCLVGLEVLNVRIYFFVVHF